MEDDKKSQKQSVSKKDDTPERPKRERKESARVEPSRKQLWRATDYGDTIHLSGAMKLAESRVAPLIAIARGYTTVESSATTDFIKTKMLMDSRSAGARQFKGLFMSSSDVLAMPWYSMSAVSSYASMFARESGEDDRDWRKRLEDGHQSRPNLFQFRAANPQQDANGKTLKYVFLSGANIVIDSNPATPSEWFSGGGDILITEGIIKGDSALTELLIDAGVSVSDLSETPTPDVARAKLSILMSQVPARDRVLILSVAGVGNWHNKPEWTDISLRERRVFVAFDGDVRSNRQVFKQARELWEYLERKDAEPNLLDLSVVTADQIARGENPKALGVDDYLAQGHGNWNDLLALSIRELPTPVFAEDNDVKPGVYRISPDGKRLEVGVESKDEYQPAYWQDVPGHAIGGRILKKITQRKPTDTERFTGNVAPADETSAEIKVEIEVAFSDRNGQPTKAIVEGPATMLAEPPSDWHKAKVGGTIPSELLMSPEWPPPKYGKEWVQAIKGYKSDEVEEQTIWDTMGWVPTASDGPSAYIAGDIVIAATKADRDSTNSGIDEKSLPGSSSFGVIDDYRYERGDTERIDEREMSEIASSERDIIRQVFDTLVTHGPWVNSAHSAVVIAAGLRPCAATRSKSTIFALGEPGSGKTWTAGQIMGFWQSRPGAWSKDTLPGSAKDTIAAIEKAVSAAMIWAIDDWAPSPDRGKAADEEDKMGAVVRSVFNGAGKRRATATMGSRETLDPIATLIVTAENELTVPSARERAIPIVFQKGALSRKDGRGNDIGLDRVNTMNTIEGTSSRLTAAVIYSIIDRVRAEFEGKWSSLIEWESGVQHELIDYAKGVAASLEPPVNPNIANRQIEMAADISLGLMHLYMLAMKLGMRDICDTIIDSRYSMGFDGKNQETLVYRVMKLVIETYYRKDNTRPGQVWVTAIRDMLAAKTGHFASGERPDHAPFEGSNQIALNDLVGWGAPRGGGPMEPKGEVLGWVYRDKDGDPFFLVHPQNAFNAARKYYPSLIQHGANMTTYVQNVLSDESLLYPKYNGKPGQSGGTHTVNRSSTGSKRGVPLRFEAVMEGIELDDVKVVLSRKGEDD